MNFRNKLSKFWTNVQLTLLPFMETRCGELSKELKELVSILELVRIEEFVFHSTWRLGRPPRDRTFMARAYVAKIVLKYSNTKRFLQRLRVDKQLRIICGWDPDVNIPSESKFSRVFQEFTNYSLPEKVHSALIKEIHKDTIIFHLMKDSVPIEAREKALKKPSIKERKKIKTKDRKLKGKVL